MHVYFLIDSVVESCYLSIGFFYFILKLKCIANSRFSYWVVLYERYIYLYTATSLAFFMIFLKIFISIKRFLVVFNRPIVPIHLNKRRVIVGLFIVSFLIDTPLVLSLEIKSKSSNPVNSLNNHTSINVDAPKTIYYLSYHVAETPTYIRVLLIISFAFRGLLAPALLLLFNVLAMKKISQKFSTIIANRRKSFKKFRYDINGNCKYMDLSTRFRF